MKRALEYEKHIQDGPEGFPDEAVHIYTESVAEKVPTAFANHPKYGKAVICTAGQGPMILWEEKPLRCPECDGDRVFFTEYVRRTIGFKEVRGDIHIFDTTNKDEIDWEDNKEEAFLCRDCNHEWPIEVEIDFD